MRFGELVIGGFPGTSLPAGFARAMRGGPRQIAALSRELHAASADLPPIVSIDQEGGRVARLKAPLLSVPPMRTVGSWGDVALAERIARAVGLELAALGFTVDYAPVLDVDTRPDNPVIGDRAFSSDAET